jgi:hypothetical protein
MALGQSRLVALPVKSLWPIQLLLRVNQARADCLDMQAYYEMEYLALEDVTQRISPFYTLMEPEWESSKCFNDEGTAKCPKSISVPK